MIWILLAFSSALLSAFSTILEKKVLFKLTALEFTFMLSIFNMLFSLFFFLSIDMATLSLDSMAILFGKTILSGLAYLSVMQALKTMELSGALPLLVLTPGLVAIFAFLLIGESLSFIEISGLLLLLVGTYTLEIKRGKGPFQPIKVLFQTNKYMYIIIALLIFTFTSIIDKLLLRDFQLPPYTFMAFQHIFLFMIFFTIVRFNKQCPVRIMRNTPKQLWGLILAISLVTIGYRYTQIEAVVLAPVALVLSVKRTSVFFATVIGGSIFKEQELIKKAIATAILIAGAILVING